MHAILLTVFISLVLVAFFVVLFLRERTSRDTIGSVERNALLPFDDGDGRGGEAAEGDEGPAAATSSRDQSG